MPATNVIYRFVSLHSDHDISASSLELWLTDPAVKVTATSVATATVPPVDTPVPAGRTRYWWRILWGPGQTLIPVDGPNKLHGKLTDTPEILFYTWTVHIT